MNKLFFLITLIGMISWSGCKDDEEPKRSKGEILAGTTSKTWNIVSSSDDDDPGTKPVCRSDSERNKDNEWEFFNNGSFEFSNGSVTGDDACQEEGCCEDVINLYGTWAFTTSDTYLVVTARGSLENGVRIPMNPEELVNARIEKITDTELVLNESDVVVTFAPVD